MIKLFSSTNCISRKKMKQWLITNKLEFEEISILENTLLKKDILRMKKSRKGFGLQRTIAFLEKFSEISQIRLSVRASCIAF